MQFLFHSATRSERPIISESFLKIRKLYEDSKYQCRFYIKSNNTDGLSKCYNEFYEWQKKVCRMDQNSCMVFVHDDVEIYDSALCEKLETAFLDPDVVLVGVAGGKSFMLNRSNIVSWHTSCPPEAWAGAVAHLRPNGDVYVNSYGPTGTAVTVDGVFMAVRCQAMEEGLRFNEVFDFDFYDLAFSIDVYRAKKKAFVANIPILHHSHGLGIKDPKYAKATDKFKEIYGNK